MNNTTHPIANTKVDLAPLRWHESLADAVAEAKRRKLPILSLRLLGRLDEELSCANSRFFRTLLYPEPRVQKALQQRFVLHWRSVRPVPVVTIDFGDGRKLIRTITGNSAHLVLDMRGRPVDALPGLYQPRGFLRALEEAERLAREVANLDDTERAITLAVAHRALSALPHRKVREEQFAPQVQMKAMSKLPPAAPPDARRAGRLAMGKMMVEQPMLDRIEGLRTTLRDDEDHNENVLHRRVHELFAVDADGTGRDERELTSWIYEELFLMPEHDPWLGLARGYSGIEHDGRVDERALPQRLASLALELA